MLMLQPTMPLTLTLTLQLSNIYHSLSASCYNTINAYNSLSVSLSLCLMLLLLGRPPLPTSPPPSSLPSPSSSGSVSPANAVIHRCRQSLGMAAVERYSFLEPRVRAECQVDFKAGQAALKRTWLAPLQRFPPSPPPSWHPGTSVSYNTNYIYHSQFSSCVALNDRQCLWLRVSSLTSSTVYHFQFYATSTRVCTVHSQSHATAPVVSTPYFHLHATSPAVSTAHLVLQW